MPVYFGDFAPGIVLGGEHAQFYKGMAGQQAHSHNAGIARRTQHSDPDSIVRSHRRSELSSEILVVLPKYHESSTAASRRYPLLGRESTTAEESGHWKRTHR